MEATGRRQGGDKGATRRRQASDRQVTSKRQESDIVCVFVVVILVK